MRTVTDRESRRDFERPRDAVERGGGSSVPAHFAELTAPQSPEEDLLALIDRLDDELGAPSAADIAWARGVTRDGR
jgi:hypothetical protein